MYLTPPPPTEVSAEFGALTLVEEEILKASHIGGVVLHRRAIVRTVAVTHLPGGKMEINGAREGCRRLAAREHATGN